MRTISSFTKARVMLAYAVNFVPQLEEPTTLNVERFAESVGSGRERALTDHGESKRTGTSKVG